MCTILRSPKPTVLGEGTFGQVQRCVADVGGTRRSVAVKVFKDCDFDLAVVWREIATLRALRGSRHVVQMIDYAADVSDGDDSVTMNIVMELCAQDTLHTRLCELVI